MDDQGSRNEKNGKITHTDILDDIGFQKYAVGFQSGYESGVRGDPEPGLEELAKMWQEAKKDLIFDLDANPKRAANHDGS